MDYSLTPQQMELRLEFEKFFSEEMKNAPFVYNLGSPMYLTDEGWAFHLNMQKKLAQKGWIARPWPKEYGGQDATITEQILFNEVMGYHNASGIDAIGVNMLGPTVIMFGTDEQKQRILPPITSGKVNYCQGWSEPGAGSDLASLKTTAIKDGDFYIINGQKMWTSGAHRATHMMLLARTDPSQKRSKGLSVLNVKMDTPGIEVRPIKYMDGHHSYNEVFFTDVKVPISELIGPENKGWDLTRETMNFERANVYLMGRLQRRLEELLEYLKNTKQAGKYLYDNPIIRQKTARLYSDLQRSFALAFRIAWEQDKAGLSYSPHLASEAKVFSTELHQRLANVATEVMGLFGQLEPDEEAPLKGKFAAMYQGSVAINTAGGTSEVQRNLIAWVGLGLPR